MKTRLLNLWEKLRSSYWFLPSLMAAGAIALAFATLALDRRWGERWTRHLSWLSGSEPEGARELLSTVAGVSMTVTGVVFSVTIVALSLASQQFGPRLLNNFMRDRGNQGVFGAFIATHLYCLLVLRTIRGTDADGFVPQLSFLIGFLLALLSVGVLIFFIHHIAESIQAMTVIANVSAELHRNVERIFPAEDDLSPTAWSRELSRDEIPPDFEPEALSLPATRSGYVQAVDEAGLLDLSARHDLLLRLERRPGQFVVRGDTLARAWPAGRAGDKELAEQVTGAFILGPERSPEQDLEYPVNELVEIALRALSPGINDPFTAITCIDHLASALCELARRRDPSPYRRDQEGRLRLILRRWSFSGAVDAAFNQIRQHGRTYASVSIRLLEAIAAVMTQTRNEEQRNALLRQAGMIERGGAVLPEEEDRRTLHERYLKIFQVMEERFGLTGGQG